MKNRLRELQVLSGSLPHFDVDLAPDKPQQLFINWLNTALEGNVLEPHAMTLSTVDHHGMPDARVLILKNADEKGWYFASSSESRKGVQLKGNPIAALTFYWPEIGRQVRIRGKVVETERDEGEEDFLHRGLTAKAIAMIGKQSSVLGDLQSFEDQLQKQFKILQSDERVVYSNWILYRVEATEVEFWQGSLDRKHTRLRYRLEQGDWKKERLYP